MGKEKFVYNIHTLRYEKVEVTKKERILRALGFLCAALFAGSLFTFAIWELFPSPKEKDLRRELKQMETQYAELNEQFERMGKVLANIQERDASVHRMLFGMDPIDPDVWNGGVGGHPSYPEIADYSGTGQLIRATREKADRLLRQIKLQSESLDTIIKMAEDREQMLASIPSIKPVQPDKLSRKVTLLSGFGYRIHPIYKVRKLHTGIDFGAPRGTPIQATGDGKVIKVEHKRTGYGNSVVIDHGYGYQTRYGHMQRIDVKVGQKVKKGEKIGVVGSSGTSTAPHCHYEIIYKGQKINPIQYCMDGLSPEEYEELVKMAATANHSFD